MIGPHIVGIQRAGGRSRGAVALKGVLVGVGEVEIDAPAAAPALAVAPTPTLEQSAAPLVPAPPAAPAVALDGTLEASGEAFLTPEPPPP